MIREAYSHKFVMAGVWIVGALRRDRSKVLVGCRSMQVGAQVVWCRSGGLVR